MARKPECIVRGVLSYVVRLSSFIGLVPVKCTKVDDGYRIYVPILACVYSYSLTIIANVVIFYGLTVRFKTDSSSDLDQQMTDYVHLLGVLKSLIVVTYAVFTAPFRINRLMICLNTLDEIQFQVHPEGLKNKSRKKYYILVNLWILFGVYLISSDLYLFHLAAVRNNTPINPAILTELSLNYCQILSSTLFEIQTVLMAFRTYIILKSINNNLTNMFKDYSPSHMKRSLERVRRLINSYASAGDVIRQINNINGFLIILLLLSLLCHIVVSAYFFINFIFDQKLTNGWVFVQGCWLVFDFLNLMMLVEPGHRTDREVARTTEILSHLMNQVSLTDRELMEELELFERMLTLNDFSYRPMDTCQLSRGLAVTILGSVTTYLVVLVQLNFGG